MIIIIVFFSSRHPAYVACHDEGLTHWYISGPKEDPPNRHQHFGCSYEREFVRAPAFLSVGRHLKFPYRFSHSVIFSYFFSFNKKEDKVVHLSFVQELLCFYFFFSLLPSMPIKGGKKKKLTLIFQWISGLNRKQKTRNPRDYQVNVLFKKKSFSNKAPWDIYAIKKYTCRHSI